MSTTKVVEKTKSEDLTSHTLSFLLSSHIKVNQDILDSLVGRDELTISEAPNDENIIGSLVIDVQKSTIRGQNCLYVHQSTTISRRPGFEHICHVTGFVTSTLDILEERRLVIVRNNNTDIMENRPLFRGGKVVPKFLEVETCRSLVRSETENCVYVSEWRRKNGKIDPKHSCPMNIQVDLPKESAFVTDSSLLLAEKILSKLERIGNFSKLMTLDKRAWCAPISLRLSKEPIDSSSEASNLMKLVKSSPVDKGTTTSYYCLKSGQLKTRVIETAQDKSFHLKRVETTEEHSYFGLDKESKDLRNLIKKRLFEESFSENLLKLQESVRNEDILALLKDAMLKLLLEKPENPLLFLRKHFKEMKECLLI